MTPEPCPSPRVHGPCPHARVHGLCPSPRVHGPCQKMTPVFTGCVGHRVHPTRPVNTGVVFDTRVHDPWKRGNGHGREHGCHFEHPCTRPVNTGSVYRAIHWTPTAPDGRSAWYTCRVGSWLLLPCTNVRTLSDTNMRSGSCRPFILPVSLTFSCLAMSLYMGVRDGRRYRKYVENSQEICFSECVALKFVGFWTLLNPACAVMLLWQRHAANTRRNRRCKRRYNCVCTMHSLREMRCGDVAVRRFYNRRCDGCNLSFMRFLTKATNLSIYFTVHSKCRIC